MAFFELGCSHVSKTLGIGQEHCNFMPVNTSAKAIWRVILYRLSLYDGRPMAIKLPSKCSQTEAKHT